MVFHLANYTAIVPQLENYLKDRRRLVGDCNLADSGMRRMSAYWQALRVVESLLWARDRQLQALRAETAAPASKRWRQLERVGRPGNLLQENFRPPVRAAKHGARTRKPQGQ